MYYITIRIILCSYYDHIHIFKQLLWSTRFFTWRREIRRLNISEVNFDVLFQYIKFNYSEQLNEALKDQSVDPNATDHEGWSLLHHCCRFGRLHCVNVLLDQQLIDVNICSPNKVMPLFLAIENENNSCVSQLLSHSKIHVNIYNQELNTALHVAAQTGNFGSIQLLLQYQQMQVDAKDGNGKTAADISRGSKLANSTEILQMLTHKQWLVIYSVGNINALHSFLNNSSTFHNLSKHFKFLVLNRSLLLAHLVPFIHKIALHILQFHFPEHCLALNIKISAFFPEHLNQVIWRLWVFLKALMKLLRIISVYQHILYSHKMLIIPH